MKHLSGAGVSPAKVLRSVRHHPKFTILIVLLLSIGSYTVAQIVEPPPPPSHFFPDGALVYAQARDLHALLDSWISSKAKADWQSSANYAQFTNSRLYLKLNDRISKWGAGGKFTFTWDNLRNASGTTSALALYDIGELKAIAATRIPFSKAKATELWLSRTRFVEKKAGSSTYYVEPRQGILAFAYTEPYLLITTEESLLTRALENLHSPANTLDQSAKWKACQKQADSDLSLFLDQQALQKTRQFQRYWIHHNADSLSAIQAAWIDVHLQNGSIQERRFFVTSNGAAANHELIRTYVDSFRKFAHETLFYQGSPDPIKSAERILKQINKFPDPYKRASYPPAFSGSAERATQADARNILLEQIDEPILQVKSETLLQASEPEELSKLLAAAEPAGQIALAYPLWDDQALFARFPQTLILQLKNFPALHQQQFLELLLRHVLLLHSTQDEGGRWKAEGNGIHVLQTMHPLYVQFHDPWLIISNEESDFRKIAQNLPQAILPPAGSYAEVNWKTGRWKFERLMRRLDHGAYQDESSPLFFSQNITSLLYALEPVVQSSVQRSENEEIARYEVE